MASRWNVYLKVRTTILKIYSRDFIFWMFALTVYQQNFPNCLPLGSKIMTIFGACFVICLRLWLFWMFCIVLKILPWVCIILVNMNTDLIQKYCVGFKVFFFQVHRDCTKRILVLLIAYGERCWIHVLWRRFSIVTRDQGPGLITQELLFVAEFYWSEKGIEKASDTHQKGDGECPPC